MVFKLLKKFNESIVQDFIYDLNQDKIFVEWGKNKEYIRAFEFRDNSFTILNQTRFKLYTTKDKNSFEIKYIIKFDLFKHRHLDNVAELYAIAQEKLKDPNYKDKIDKDRQDKIDRLNRAHSDIDDIDVGIRNAWNMPNLGR